MKMAVCGSLFFVRLFTVLLIQLVWKTAHKGEAVPVK